MRFEAEDVRRTAHDISKAGAGLEGAAKVAGDSRRSLPGKIVFGVSSIRLGMSLFRVGSTLLKRHPVVGTLVIAGLVWTLVTPRVRQGLSRYE
jgi:hypothetical protein